jgi:hypothetical protein
VRSDDRALLMLFLFSDVGPDDAPTRIRVGSHLLLPLLLAPAGDAGLTTDQERREQRDRLAQTHRRFQAEWLPASAVAMGLPTRTVAKVLDLDRRDASIQDELCRTAAGKTALRRELRALEEAYRRAKRQLLGDDLKKFEGTVFATEIGTLDLLPPAAEPSGSGNSFPAVPTFTVGTRDYGAEGGPALDTPNEYDRLFQ